MKSAHLKKIGMYFRKKRLARRLTQEEVSNFLQYDSKQIVSNWERGISAPPIGQIRALISLFGLDSNEVLDLFLKVKRNELTQKFGVGSRIKVKKS